MCSGDCRTFLWGGTGVPTYNGGRCSCVCENSSWSDVNLLGRPSCVPVTAHQVFGWVGLAVSVISLAHVIHHLRRQLQFHAEQPAAASSPVEKCRRGMHIYYICSVTTFLCYFSLVLGGALRWSIVVLCCTQVPTSIGALLTLRMWISTTDPRLLRESAELLAASNWLQTCTGKIVGYFFFNIHGGVAAAVAIGGYTETAVKILATGDGCLGVAFAAFFWYIGKFLVAAIDRSLQRNPEAEGGAQGRSNSTLLAARKKVMKIILFFVQQCIMGSIMVLFSAHSKYGTEAPLLLFCLPFVLPVQAIMVCTQLFTGRSKLRGTAARQATSGTAFRMPPSGGMSTVASPTGLPKLPLRRTQRVIAPTEVGTSTAEQAAAGGVVEDPVESFVALPEEA